MVGYNSVTKGYFFKPGIFGKIITGLQAKFFKEY